MNRSTRSNEPLTPPELHTPGPLKLVPLDTPEGRILQGKGIDLDVTPVTIGFDLRANNYAIDLAPLPDPLTAVYEAGKQSANQGSLIAVKGVLEMAGYRFGERVIPAFGSERIEPPKMNGDQ